MTKTFRDERKELAHSCDVFITAIAADVALEDTTNMIHFNSQQGATSTTVEKLKGMQRKSEQPPYTAMKIIYLFGNQTRSRR